MKLRNLFLSLCVALLLSTGSAFAGKININTATQQELESLKGIGPSTAAAIIEHREQAGAYSSLEDLMDVKGIGDKKLEKLAEHITVSDPK